MTLVNSVLSAVPLYTLSLYKMPTKIHRQIDRVRNQFLWQGTGTKRKTYSLVNWKVVCLNKEYGGLGV